MRDAVDEIERGDSDANDLVLLSQVNQRFHLSEPLRMTALRPWWDILGWRLAMQREQELVEKAEEMKSHGR